MNSQQMIEEDFKKQLEELDVPEDNDMVGVYKYFYVKGLRMAAKLVENEE